MAEPRRRELRSRRTRTPVSPATKLSFCGWELQPRVWSCPVINLLLGCNRSPASRFCRFFVCTVDCLSLRAFRESACCSPRRPSVQPSTDRLRTLTTPLTGSHHGVPGSPHRGFAPGAGHDHGRRRQRGGGRGPRDARGRGRRGRGRREGRGGGGGGGRAADELHRLPQVACGGDRHRQRGAADGAARAPGAAAALALLRHGHRRLQPGRGGAAHRVPGRGRGRRRRVPAVPVHGRVLPAARRRRPGERAAGGAHRRTCGRGRGRRGRARRDGGRRRGRRRLGRGPAAARARVHAGGEAGARGAEGAGARQGAPGVEHGQGGDRVRALRVRAHAARRRHHPPAHRGLLGPAQPRAAPPGRARVPRPLPRFSRLRLRRAQLGPRRAREAPRGAREGRRQGPRRDPRPAGSQAAAADLNGG